MKMGMNTEKEGTGYWISQQKDTWTTVCKRNNYRHTTKK